MSLPACCHEKSLGVSCAVVVVECRYRACNPLGLCTAWLVGPVLHVVRDAGIAGASLSFHAPSRSLSVSWWTAYVPDGISTVLPDDRAFDVDIGTIACSDCVAFRRALVVSSVADGEIVCRPRFC